MNGAEQEQKNGQVTSKVDEVLAAIYAYYQLE